MKSGNIIEIDGVIDWKVINGVNGVTSITIMQSVWAKYKLIVTTIELSQIEAVVSL